MSETQPLDDATGYFRGRSQRRGGRRYLRLQPGETKVVHVESPFTLVPVGAEDLAGRPNVKTERMEFEPYDKVQVKVHAESGDFVMNVPGYLGEAMCGQLAERGLDANRDLIGTEWVVQKNKEGRLSATLIGRRN